MALAVARALRRRGIDVETANDLDAVGLTDEAVLTACLATGHVLVTHDRDCLRLHDHGARHAGIVYSEQGSRSVGEVVARLLLVAQVLTPSDMANRVEFM